MSSLLRKIRKNIRRQQAQMNKRTAFANPTARRSAQAPEHLTAAAILRAGELFTFGFRSHAQIRSRLGDTDPYQDKRRPADTEGFMTNTGRFLSRSEAKLVGEVAGQCQPMVRELLSSDINWQVRK